MEVTLLSNDLIKNNIIRSRNTIYNNKETQGILDKNDYIFEARTDNSFIPLQVDKDGKFYFYSEAHRKVFSEEQLWNITVKKPSRERGYMSREMVECCFYIKPYIKFEDEEWAIIEGLIKHGSPIIREENGLSIIKLGTMPQISVDLGIHLGLKEASKNAPFVDSFPIFGGYFGKGKRFGTFTYDGKEYAKFMAKVYRSADIAYDLRTLGVFLMTPVEWVIDYENHGLYSLNTLNHFYSDLSEFKNRYSSLIDFLNSGFLQEAFEGKSVLESLEEAINSNNPYYFKAEGFEELKEILSKINGVTNYEYDENRVIVSKVKKMISEYNKAIKGKNNEKSPLTLVPDTHLLYTTLLHDLRDVYNRILINNENLKIYIKYFNIIHRSYVRDFLDTNDSLSEELKIIHDTLEKNMPEMLEDFNGLLDREMGRIEKEIGEMYTNIEGKSEPIKLSDLENDFIFKLQLFLVKVQERSTSIVSKTEKKYMSELDDVQKTTLDNYNSFLTKEINKEANIILDMIRNTSLEKMDRDYEWEVSDILKSIQFSNSTESLKRALISLNKIELSLKKDIGDNKTIDIEGNQFIPLDEQQKKI